MTATTNEAPTGQESPEHTATQLFCPSLQTSMYILTARTEAVSEWSRSWKESRAYAEKWGAKEKQNSLDFVYGYMKFDMKLKQPIPRPKVLTYIF